MKLFNCFTAIKGAIDRVAAKEIYAWIERILEKENEHVEIQLQLVMTIKMLQDTVE